MVQDSSAYTVLFFSAGRLKCRKCGKIFVTKFWISRHRCIERYYKCRLCGERFEYACRLKTHNMIKHGAQKTALCQYCGKSFPFKSLVERHIRGVHRNEKPFQCQYCPERFALKRTRYAHELEHKGLTPYKCQYCHKGYKSSWSYNNHKCNPPCFLDISKAEVFQKENETESGDTNKTFSTAFSHDHMYLRTEYLSTKYLGIKPSESSEPPSTEAFKPPSSKPSNPSNTKPSKTSRKKRKKSKPKSEPEPKFGAEPRWRLF